MQTPSNSKVLLPFFFPIVETYVAAAAFLLLLWAQKVRVRTSPAFTAAGFTVEITGTNVDAGSSPARICLAAVIDGKPVTPATLARSGLCGQVHFAPDSPAAQSHLVILAPELLRQGDRLQVSLYEASWAIGTGSPRDRAKVTVQALSELGRLTRERVLTPDNPTWTIDLVSLVQKR